MKGISSLAQTSIPSSQNAVGPSVNFRQYNQATWNFDASRFPHTWSGSEVVSNLLRDEPIARSQYGREKPAISRENPVFGLMTYQLNPLDQNQTNLKGEKMKGETQFQNNTNPKYHLANPTSSYPFDNYTNGTKYNGSQMLNLWRVKKEQTPAMTASKPSFSMKNKI